MLIAQITDTHLRTNGSLLEGRIDTRAALVAAIDHVNRLNRPPDLVLLTGDLTDQGPIADYAELRRRCDRLDVRYLPIPGNHDDRAAFRAAFADRGHFDAGEADRGDPFLHYALVMNGRRFIGLDTVIPGAVSGGLCAARLAWLADCLAADTATPTLVFMHHPPFATGIRFLDDPPFVGAAALERLVRANTQIQLIVCGHAHRVIFTGWAGTVAAVAPSTVYQMPLAFCAGERYPATSDPPAVALYLWEDVRNPIGYASLIGGAGTK